LKPGAAVWASARNRNIKLIINKNIRFMKGKQSLLNENRAQKVYERPGPVKITIIRRAAIPLFYNRCV